MISTLSCHPACFRNRLYPRTDGDPLDIEPESSRLFVGDDEPEGTDPGGVEIIIITDDPASEFGAERVEGYHDLFPFACAGIE